MKKIYAITIIVIFLIVTIFLFFFTDENTANKRFLFSFGIKVEDNPCIAEDFYIPERFDDYYNSYNSLQIESGLSLSPYKGKKATRYTYKVLNFPDKDVTVFVNVITVYSKPVAGDINSPKLNGFMLPLSYFISQK